MMWEDRDMPRQLDSMRQTREALKRRQEKSKMTKDETRKAIEVMQAYVDGAEIEFRVSDSDTDWAQLKGEGWRWNWYGCEYRIRPKPREFLIAPVGSLWTEVPEREADNYESVKRVREVIDD